MLGRGLILNPGLLCHGTKEQFQEFHELLLQGYSMPQISERLFISLDTVRTHMRHIYQKAGVHSKVELIELSKKP